MILGLSLQTSSLSSPLYYLLFLACPLFSRQSPQPFEEVKEEAIETSYALRTLNQDLY